MILEGEGGWKGVHPVRLANHEQVLCGNALEGMAKQQGEHFLAESAGSLIMCETEPAFDETSYGSTAGSAGTPPNENAPPYEDAKNG